MKRCLAALFAACLLLSGCSGDPAPAEVVLQTTTPPAATVPADGDPGDVTCKGSYTGQGAVDTVVARIGDAKLTLGELSVFYWDQAARHRQSEAQPSPDWHQGLDTQSCEIDDSVASWQQYFLREALNTWHTAQALVSHSQDVPLPTEEAYQPVQANYDTYMKGMPITPLLYGYEPFYSPNSMHQAYLDAIPQQLSRLAADQGYGDTAQMARQAFGTGEAAVPRAAALYNLGYMYFTTLTYDIAPSQGEIQGFYEENREMYPEEESCVTFRQILLAGSGRQQEAEELLHHWEKKTKAHEGAFADLAYHHSEDKGSALDGGLYRRVKQDQVQTVLADWCFDPQRQPGDTAILESEAGTHILYFSQLQSLGYVQAEADCCRQKEGALLQEIRDAYPMTVDYSAILLETAEPEISLEQLLYPDVAHERFPEIPVYLQQDYGDTMYGNYPLRSNGCGITSLAMLASYMADEELTPPEMCARYGGYSHYNGTDGMIFIYEPPVLGFYLREKTYDVNVAREALREGQVVISIQSNGYWTRGGHYIVLEHIDEEDRVQVRDSNLYNYGRIKGHQEDRHAWGTVTRAGSGYWIFEDKVTRIPNCHRCGENQETVGTALTEAYCCAKCEKALIRREMYLKK